MQAVNPGRAYTAPPITEAVIDLQFFEPLSESNLRKVVKKLKRGYPNELPQENITAHFDIASKATSYQSTPLVQLSSHDETDRVVVGPTSQTWARLAPYPGWNEFLKRFSDDFKTALAVTGPRKISRIGLRYINRIDVPVQDGIVHYEEYLTINLPLPEFLDPVGSYGWRIEKPFPSDGLVAILQSAMVIPEIPGTGAFILDIDIVAQHNLPLKLPEIFEKLAVMRALKNNIFELSISEKARESFKQ